MTHTRRRGAFAANAVFWALAYEAAFSAATEAIASAGSEILRLLTIEVTPSLQAYENLLEVVVARACFSEPPQEALK